MGPSSSKTFKPFVSQCHELRRKEEKKGGKAGKRKRRPQFNRARETGTLGGSGKGVYFLKRGPKENGQGITQEWARGHRRKNEVKGGRTKQSLSQKKKKVKRGDVSNGSLRVTCGE